MRYQGAGKCWFRVGLTALLCGAVPGSFQVQAKDIIDLSAGDSSVQVQATDLVDLSRGAPSRVEAAAGVIELSAGDPPGHVRSTGLIDLSAGDPPGRARSTGLIDLSAGDPPGRNRSSDVIDLTGGTSTAPGPTSTELDLTAGGSPGQAPTSTEFDLTDGSTGQGETSMELDLTGSTGQELEADVFDLTADHSPAASSISSPSSSLPSTPVVVAQPLPERARVVRVIDGDTYELEGGYRVRLSGVNTPEKKERVGPAVSEAVRKLLLHKEVTLSYGPVARDGYGRLIGDVKVDGQSVAEILIRQGLAHMFIIPPGRPDNYQAMVSAQAEAQQAKRGIWTEERYRSSLHITSFHANARGDDRTNLAGEYLRVANTSGGDLNLSGYVVTNQRGMKLELPDMVVPNGYTFQIFSGRGDTQGSLETPYRVFWNTDTPIWDNDDEAATIFDPKGRMVDQVFHAPKSRRAPAFVSRAGT